MSSATEDTTSETGDRDAKLTGNPVFFVFGDSANGKLGNGEKPQAPFASAVGAECSNVRQIGAGAHNTVWSSPDGDMYIAGVGKGRDKSTSLLAGYPDLEYSSKFLKMVLPHKLVVRSIALGSYHALLATEDGKCYSWGNGAGNDYCSEKDC